MSAPVLGSVGAELYNALEPLAGDDAANGYALAHICQAVGLMRQFVADLSEDQGDRPGWTGLVDVETSPAVALPWLAQIPGVKLTTGASEDVQRNEIRIRAGQARGRPASMVAKIKATLTGTQSVRLVERAGGSAWQIEAIVRPSEVPDIAATTAAGMSQKPGGDIFTLIATDDVLWEDTTRTWDAVAGGVHWDNVTLPDVT